MKKKSMNRKWIDEKINSGTYAGLSLGSVKALQPINKIFLNQVKMDKWDKERG